MVLNKAAMYLPITTRYIPAQKSTVGDSFDEYLSSMFVQSVVKKTYKWLPEGEKTPSVGSEVWS